MAQRSRNIPVSAMTAASMWMGIEVKHRSVHPRRPGITIDRGTQVEPTAWFLNLESRFLQELRPVGWYWRRLKGLNLRWHRNEFPQLTFCIQLNTRHTRRNRWVIDRDNVEVRLLELAGFGDTRMKLQPVARSSVPASAFSNYRFAECSGDNCCYN